MVYSIVVASSSCTLNGRCRKRRKRGKGRASGAGNYVPDGVLLLLGGNGEIRSDGASIDDVDRTY